MAGVHSFMQDIVTIYYILHKWILSYGPCEPPFSIAMFSITRGYDIGPTASNTNSNPTIATGMAVKTIKGTGGSHRIAEIFPGVDKNADHC